MIQFMFHLNRQCIILCALLSLLKFIICKNDEDAVRQCFQSQVASLARISHRTIDPFFYSSNAEPIVVYENVIDNEDIKFISILADCIKVEFAESFEDRAFDSNGYGGGNNVTYMNGFMQKILPELTDHIRHIAVLAAEKAGWRPYPQHLGIRCIERLDYYTGGELLLHTDTDSVYTMVLMLADEKQFHGGKFYIKEPSTGSVVEATPNRYGGILFDSMALHGVYPITKGERVVLAVEFWPYSDTDTHDKRPDSKWFKGREVIPEFQRVSDEDVWLINKRKVEHDTRHIYDDEVIATTKRMKDKEMNKERRLKNRVKAEERDKVIVENQIIMDGIAHAGGLMYDPKEYLLGFFRRELASGFGIGMLLGSLVTLFVANFSSHKKKQEVIKKVK